MHVVRVLTAAAAALLSCAALCGAAEGDGKVSAEASGTVYSEALRPQFHFSSQKGWMNDPNGLVYFAGEYHLFFQHNPTGTEWGNMHWGHAVSRDLVHWTELPIALAPDDLGTMFSGSAVVDEKNTAALGHAGDKPLVAIYTAAGKQFSQCVASSLDRGRTWTKYVHNPVLQGPDAESRDPKVFWHTPTKRWVMALYLQRNTYCLFASPDLKQWQKLSELEFPGCSECPDLFPLPVDANPRNQKWVFVAGDGSYMIGMFDGTRFVKESGPFREDYGASFYATQTYSGIPAQDGRRIQIAWMRGGQYPGMPFNQQMTFPCELSLRTFPEGVRLCRQPVKEIRSLYVQEKQAKVPGIGAGTKMQTPLRAELLDIQADVDMQQATGFVLKVAGQQVCYDAAKGELTCLDRTAPLKPAAGRVSVRVLVDRTSIEVYAGDGRVCMSSCFVPGSSLPPPEISTTGGGFCTVNLRVRELRSAWR